MKYIVIKTINSELDACSLTSGYNKTGVATCSTGDGFPWVSVESGLFIDLDIANDYARNLFKSLLTELTNFGAHDDWEIRESCTPLRLEVSNQTIGCESKSIWVLSVDVLEIKD